MLGTPTHQSACFKLLILLPLLVFLRKPYAQENRIFLANVDSVLTYSVLDSLRIDLRDTFYHKNEERLKLGVERFQKEVTLFHRHNCCGCTVEVRDREIARLTAMRDSLVKGEEALSKVDSLIKAEFKRFAFEVCVELTEQYVSTHQLKVLVLDSSQLGNVCALGDLYLTDYLIQQLNSTDLLDQRLEVFKPSLAEAVTILFDGS